MELDGMLESDFTNGTDRSKICSKSSVVSMNNLFVQCMNPKRVQWIF